jgi:predicted transcriptional regulator of viral defense system
MAARGTLEHRAHGVYRIPQVPIDERTELIEAVLWAKGRGVLAGETALALLDLADVNPRRIHLTVPKGYRPRRAGGERYCIHPADPIDGPIDEVDGIPTADAETAIRQATAWGTDGTLVAQAIRRAQARELIGVLTAARLTVELEDRAARKGTRG